MNLSFTPAQIDLLIGVLSFFFTVALLSYVIGDNPLYRLALHIFIGIAAGYASLVVIYQVLRPRLISPLSSGDPVVTALTSVPLVLFLFLVLKLSPRTSSLGNIGLAFMIGVGTAVAMGGALTGTLLPQVQASWLSLLPQSGIALINNLIMVIGTITTLLYFQFWAAKRTRRGEPQRTQLMKGVSGVGQFFLVLTLGTIYGGMILSGIAIFSERLATLYGWITTTFVP